MHEGLSDVTLHERALGIKCFKANLEGEVVADSGLMRKRSLQTCTYLKCSIQPVLPKSGLRLYTLDP